MAKITLEFNLGLDEEQNEELSHLAKNSDSDFSIIWNKESIITLGMNGDIYIKEKFVTNDKKVSLLLRRWLTDKL